MVKTEPTVGNRAVLAADIPKPGASIWNVNVAVGGQPNIPAEA
jgi:hypothetical protein